MGFAEGLLEATIRIAIPILLVTIGEIIAERAGVLNIGLEGMILVGAFGGFYGAYAWQSPEAGLVLALLAGAALAAGFAWFVVRWGLDPIVTGVAINIFALGVTGVLVRAITAHGGSPFVETLARIPLGPLAELPYVGRALFQLNVLGYAAFAVALLAAVFLRRTSPGLVLRATGENPDAVAAAGGSPLRVRWLATLFGGALAGLAGAYLSVGYSNTFVENMSAGRGFVALAIVVFARWNPVLAIGGALLFGLSMALQVRLQGQTVQIPYQFFQMLPYVLTLIVLATASRRGGGAPAALARPWKRGG